MIRPIPYYINGGCLLLVAHEELVGDVQERYLLDELFFGQIDDDRLALDRQVRLLKVITIIIQVLL